MLQLTQPSCRHRPGRSALALPPRTSPRAWFNPPCSRCPVLSLSSPSSQNHIIPVTGWLISSWQGKGLHVIFINGEFGSSAPDSRHLRDPSGPKSTTQTAHRLPRLQRNTGPWPHSGQWGHLPLSAGSQRTEDALCPAQQLGEFPPAAGTCPGMPSPHSSSPTHVTSAGLSADALAAPWRMALCLLCLPSHQEHSYTPAALHLLSSGPWVGWRDVAAGCGKTQSSSGKTAVTSPKKSGLTCQKCRASRRRNSMKLLLQIS